MKHVKLSLFLLIICVGITVHGSDTMAEFDVKEITPASAQKLTFEDYFNRGTDALRKGETDTAIFNLNKAKEAKPIVPQTHFNLGVALETKKDIDGAIEAYKDAILQRLDYPKAHLQLAKLLQSRGLLDQAIKHFQQAIQFDANIIDAALTVARLLCEQEQFEDALPYFKRFVEKRPHDVGVRFEYANTLNTTNQLEKAVEIYFELLKERPNDVGILYNTAYTLKKMGRIQDAMPYYQAALKHKPEHAEAHFSLGLAYLATGDFKNGWPEYEWRWQRNTQLTPRNFTQPQWDGTSLNDKTILLHAEQGLGDTFQFVRYAKHLKDAYNVTIIFASQRPLQTFISRCCPCIDQVVTLDAVPTNFDVHAPLLTLPLLLKSDEQTIPRDIPYITPDPTLVEFWKRRLQKDTQFKVGICWQGNNKYSTPFLRAVVAAKSAALATFAQLGCVKGVTFYSLQRETGTDQLNTLSDDFKLITFEENFDQSRGRFMDTAAVIKNLDLVITVDTSIAHLSAAIGTPVWTLLPEPADWRWMIKRTDTPWYPNMRLFRQTKHGDWDTVIHTICQELEALVSPSDLVNKQPIVPTDAHTQQSAVCGMTIVEQLKKEQALLEAKFKQKAQKLSSLSVSLQDPEFVKELRSLYLLSEMQERVTEKIATWEE